MTESSDSGGLTRREAVTLGLAALGTTIASNAAEAELRTPLEQETADKFAKEVEGAYQKKYGSQIRVVFYNNHHRSIEVEYKNSKGEGRAYTAGPVPGISIGSRKSLSELVEMFQKAIRADSGSPAQLSW